MSDFEYKMGMLVEKGNQTMIKNSKRQLLSVVESKGETISKIEVYDHESFDDTQVVEATVKAK